MKPCSRRLTPAQEALGTHDDTAVAAGKFLAEGHAFPDALFAAGFLQAHLATTARQAHKALRAVMHAREFWHRR